MDIICRHCNATYSIPDHKVPSRKAAAACKRCGNRIVIEPSNRPQEPPLASVPSAVPEPPDAAPPRQHDPSIVDAIPQARDFDPRRYRLSAILKPNRKGRYATRLNRQKMKILTAVKPTLDRLLARDEQVLSIAGGTAYHPIEIFFGNGFLTMLYNRYALAATERRLVMVNTNHRMTRIGHYLFQMPYASIRKTSRGLFRTSLSLKRKTGGRRVFTSMKRAFSAQLQEVIKPRLTIEESGASEKVAGENLCPACFKPLASGTDACPACHAAFKSVGRATLRSLLLPGWGDWYLGHRVLGALELLGSLFVWSIVLNLVLQGGVESIAGGAFLLICYNGFDALLTRHMARKGLMLESRPREVSNQNRLAVETA